MDDTIAALEAELPSSEMNVLVTEILASSLRSIGLFANGARHLADLPPDKQPASYYERWLDRSIRHLQDQDLLAADLTFRREVRPLAELWDEWEVKVSEWASDPQRQAQKALLQACLRGLPAVLSGSQRATDVMFPNSSMHLVEGIYRANLQADYFNDALGRALSASIEQQLHVEPDRKFRIIEIGAGTGGTTAALLPFLRRYPVEEYCYTDLSRAFLMHAEKHFQPLCPALTTAIFDVSRPLDSQSVAANRYDFAIAANVLHATADICETIRNAKAVLKNRGVLLLNEISGWSLSNHLTFGLLEGWWLYEDADVRLPGSPGLSSDTWRELLTAEGFESIVFPAEEAHRFGQQIVGAVSNGWTRQRIVKHAAPPPVETADAKRAAPASASSAARTEQLAADHTRRIITAKLAEVLRMDADAIGGDAPFADFGVDSIVGVNLVRMISEALQIELETTSLFEYSTVDELTSYILKNWHDQITASVSAGEPDSLRAAPLRPDKEGRAEQDSIGATRFSDVRNSLELGESNESRKLGIDPIAIIGMSGRFAESEDLDAFWQHLAEGRDLVKQVSRWSPEECVPAESSPDRSCRYGSFIDSIDRFDAPFFGISALEAAYMDPQQRLFLEESWKALENAGYAGQSVREKQCGVYVGCGASGYNELSATDAPAQAFWGNSQAIIPARIAYCLNLQGPALAVDTACSSSLVAIHLACQGLWTRETEMAVAGGVFLQATPGFYRVANRAGMLSTDGKCYSFDSRASGFVPGEGVGVLILKRLTDAVADGDHIHGVIAGSGINQDGRSNGLIAPNGRAQERLERSVYERFEIDPASIQVVEAHGTGTLLGDSVEYGALSRVFRDHTDRKGFCALGTVKTNIGHASTAAGVAGALKVLLALRHRLIPPSLHFEQGNPAIDLQSGPFYVNTELRDWSADGDGVRRAAISSFGFGGTNAHLIIEEAPASERTAVERPGYVVALSARTDEQLRQHARNLCALLKRSPGLSMNDVSFSLFVGRMHFTHRLAFVASDQDEAIQRLEQWVATGGADGARVSEVQESRVRERGPLTKLGNRCIRECGSETDAEYLESLAAIADLYVQGYSLDFPALFPVDSKRIPLPTYPFAGERYWAGLVNPSVRQDSNDAGHSAQAPADQRVWLFARGQTGPAAGRSVRTDAMGAADKMALFLRQEAALQLQKAIEDIPTDQSFFDLGLTSLTMSHVVQNTNRLLGEEILPSVLFDYGDIDSFAAYLAMTYPARVDAVTAVRQQGGRSDPDRQEGRVPQPIPHTRMEHATSPFDEVDVSFERILESLSLPEESVHVGYEKVKF